MTPGFIYANSPLNNNSEKSASPFSPASQPSTTSKIPASTSAHELNYPISASPPTITETNSTTIAWPDYAEPTVAINNVTFNVEIADTPYLRAKGLMYRYRIAPNKGMLFIFDEPKKPQFWMKNTFISLDIIWINSLYTIVGIKENALPYSETTYSPNHFSSYVLEIKGGQSSKLGIKVGDSVKFLGPIKHR